VSLRADAMATLEDWRPATFDQMSLREVFLGFLAARPDACQRSCAPGHLTASAIVLDASAEHVLLTLHPKIGAWVQLGGHCEPSDTTLAGVALREATEESGIAGLAMEPVPVHVAAFRVTPAPGRLTRHFDVRFVVRAPDGAQPVRSTESVDLRWWPTTALPPDPGGLSGLPAMLAAAR
jgi:8-oxo-dGTP pyrophosphatase MutT (NUDIX family)